MDPVEQLFARFRDHGDTGALAEVFDQIAPRLLRLALHLTRSQVEAEDLLQATFLIAIEKARAFDERRSLEAWLVGILQKQGSVLLRRRKRWRGKPSATEAHTDDPHPLERAATGETLAAVLRALAHLDELYREPLRLRLVEGLSPVEIAERLDRSPGAVRVQLHRGIGMLKRLLPPGLAIAVLAPGRGLAAVKAQVLASAAAGAATSVALIGGVLVKKVIVAALALLACALVGWTAWSNANLGARAGEDAGPAPAIVAATASAPTSSAARSEVAASAPSEAVRAPRGAGSLLVRLVETETRAPLEDVLIKVVERQGRVERFGTHELRTDARGEALFARLPAGRITVGFDNHYAPAERGPSEHAIVAGERAVIELALDQSRVVAGSVVDPSGAPVPFAELWVQRGMNTRYASFVKRADGEGRFALRFPFAHAYVAARAPGGLASAFVGTGPLDPARAPLRRVGAPTGGDVAGRVVDARGIGVAGAEIEIRVRDREESNRQLQSGEWEVTLVETRVQTDAQGAFLACGVPAGTVRVSARTETHAPATRDLELAPKGTGSVELVLQAGARVAGVVRNRDGAPIAGAQVTREEGKPGFARIFDEGGSAVSDADGSYELNGLAAGIVELAVYERLHRSVTTRLEVAAGSVTRWDPVLLPQPTISGTVVDEARQPIAHCRVEAICTSAIDTTGGLGQADAEGRFTIALPAGERFRFRVAERGVLFYAELPIPDDVRVGTQDLVLILPDALRSTAYLVGCLAGSDGRPMLDVSVGITNGVWSARGQEQVRPDGSFRFGALPPGRVWLDVGPRKPDAPHGRLGPYDLAARQTLDVGKVVLPKPATLTLRVARLGLGPLARGSIEVRTRDDLESHCLQIAQVRDGLLRAVLLPGAYELELFGDDFMSTTITPTLAPGENRTMDLELEPAVRREVRYPVPDPAGWTRSRSAKIVLQRTTGEVIEAGEEVDIRANAPTTRFYAYGLGTYVLTLTTDDGRRFEGRFEIDSLAPKQRPLDVPVRELR